jgi:hypothetical protein
MFKVTVKSAEVTDRSGVKAGRPWRMVTQSAWVQLPGKPFPVEVTITLRDGQVPFAPGDYVLDASAGWVSRYGNLELDLAKLKPIAVVSPARAG